MFDVTVEQIVKVMEVAGLSSWCLGTARDGGFVNVTRYAEGWAITHKGRPLGNSATHEYYHVSLLVALTAAADWMNGRDARHLTDGETRPADTYHCLVCEQRHPRGTGCEHVLRERINKKTAEA